MQAKKTKKTATKRKAAAKRKPAESREAKKKLRRRNVEAEMQSDEEAYEEVVLASDGEVTEGDLNAFLDYAEASVAKWPEWKKRVLANFAPGSSAG